jgi:hypothetical protein
MWRGFLPSGANVEETGFTLEGRVLCGDDSCVGTVGPDKRCKVCGKPCEGDAEVGSGATVQGSDDVERARPAVADDASAENRPGDDDAAPGERMCCPDDACIGIIGPNGECGICGKSA